MKADTTTTAAIKAVLKQMSTGYARRDINLLRQTLDEDAFFLGTGQHEVARGIEDVLVLPQNDWNQTDSTEINFRRVHVYGAGNFAWCDCDATFIASSHGNKIEVPTRMTGVFRRLSGEWRLVQGHFSVAAANQPEGASFPGQPMLATR